MTVLVEWEGDKLIREHRRRIADHTRLVKEALSTLKQQVENSRCIVAALEQARDEHDRRYQAWFSETP